jgi:hypothetical protein
VSLSAPELPILLHPRQDSGKRVQSRQEILDQARGVLGHRVVLQWSDLHAGSVRGSGFLEFVVSHNGRVITGMQMMTSAEHNSGDMGAQGDPPLALRRSIDLAIKANSAGQHINYLEIYKPDVLADDMQPVLRDAASLFAR